MNVVRGDAICGCYHFTISAREASGEHRLETKVESRPTRDEVEGRLNRIEAEVVALRSDVTQFALALGARTRPERG